ncbi:MAG: hypothetical protein Q8R24_09235 [Legionellaceae bacterium]|nr:hypothetical protein [Legionellaceae bacterium]
MAITDFFKNLANGIIFTAPPEASGAAEPAIVVDSAMLNKQENHDSYVFKYLDSLVSDDYLALLEPKASGDQINSEDNVPRRTSIFTQYPLKSEVYSTKPVEMESLASRSVESPFSDHSSDSGSPDAEALESPTTRGLSASPANVPSAEDRDDILSKLERKNKILHKLKILKDIKKLSTDKDKASEAAKFFTPYVDRHWQLARQYTVLRKKIRDDLEDAGKRQNEAFVQRLGDVMVLASLLEAVHEQGLNVPREKRVYLRDQKAYDQLLIDQNIDCNIAVYKLCLASEHPKMVEGCVYLKTNDEGNICYSVITPTGEQVENQPTDILAPKVFTEPELKRFKNKILSLAFNRGHTDFSWEDDPVISGFGTQTIRDWVLENNWIRLLLLRLRRDCFMLLPFLQDHPEYQQGLRAVESGGTFFFFSNLAWIFFLPRLLTNIGLIYKHVFDASSMTDIELELGWKVRAHAQFVRRWQELANDMAWFSNGITTCFFLAGKTPVIGMYLGVAMQGYDLVVASVRFYIEIKRYNEIKKDYLAAHMEKESQEMREFLQELEERMAFDRMALGWNVFNFSVLLLCVCLTTVTGSPLIPLIAATLAVVMTLIHYAATRWFESKRLELNYGNQVIPNTARCSIMTNQIPAEKASDIPLGIFSAGYIRVHDVSMTCCTCLMSVKPDWSNVSIGDFKAAYIRAKNEDDGLDNLYYVNKVSKTITQLKMGDDSWTDYDSNVTSNNQPSAVTVNQLSEIKRLTKHTHGVNELFYVNKQTNVRIDLRVKYDVNDELLAVFDEAIFSNTGSFSMTTTDAPNADLSNIDFGSFNAGYVRVIDDDNNINTLYYVNQLIGKSTQLSGVTADILAVYDSEIAGSAVAKELSVKDLNQITLLTKHTHLIKTKTITKNQFEKTKDINDLITNLEKENKQNTSRMASVKKSMNELTLNIMG